MHAAAHPLDPREEWACAVTHGVGAVAAFAGGTVLIALAARGSGWQLASAIVFAASLLLLYLASTLYHAATDPRAKARLKVFDHCAIYLLIAGTYTPVTLGVLRDSIGWPLLAVIWALAVAGVLFKVVAGARFRRLSTLLYVAMGWVALVAIKPLWLHMQPGGLAWLFAGGVAYTGGVAFYLRHDRMRYSHFVWHLFVLAGTACHFVMVLLYAN